MATKAKAKSEAAEEDARASRISQSDIPRHSLEDALRIPTAIVENYADAPTSPLKVARAMNISPTSSTFRMLCGASVAYGLTTGGYNAPEIKLEPLSKRILRPTKEADDLAARREAFLKPRVTHEFLSKYSGASLPRPDIAANVLVEMDVPSDRTAEVFNQIVNTAEALGLISTIKDKKYVDLTADLSAAGNGEIEESEIEGASTPSPPIPPITVTAEVAKLKRFDPTTNRRVFITHGRNQSFIEPIKKLLQFGELEAVISVERQSVSQPVPDKVMAEMRSCGAAIIHVDAEMRLMDQEAKEHIVLNPNVLIEIGAAMALYGRRFILLVRDGVKLPSNLQGLFEVRYSAETLDGDATIKLLEAINAMKKQPTLGGAGD